jgi:hypothetical protein
MIDSYGFREKGTYEYFKLIFILMIIQLLCRVCGGRSKANCAGKGELSRGRNSTGGTVVVVAVAEDLLKMH